MALDLYMNPPIGPAGIILALIFMQNFRSSERRPFDVLGFLLGGSSLAALMYGLSQLSRSDTNVPALAIVLAAGLALGIAAVIHARRYPFPLIDPATLRIPTFALATLGGGLLFRMTVWATPLMWALMFQTLFGMSAFVSGILIAWCALGDLGMLLIARPMLRRFGFRNILLVNGFLCALANLSCVIFAGDADGVIAAVLLDRTCARPVHLATHFCTSTSRRRHQQRDRACGDLAAARGRVRVAPDFVRTSATAPRVSGAYRG